MIRSLSPLLIGATLLLAGCDGGLGPAPKLSPAQLAVAAEGTRFVPVRGLTPTLIALVPTPRQGEVKFGTVGVSGDHVMIVARARGVPESSARAQLIEACLKSARGAHVGRAERRARGGEVQLFVDCRS